MYDNFKRHHGKKFADWLYETKKLDFMFNHAVGWSYTINLLKFALAGLDQIEPALTKDERMRIY